MVAGGIASYDAGKYTRSAMNINARNVQTGSLAERDKIRLASRLQMGRQLNDQASSGFAVGTGSSIDALRESAINRELDLMTSHANADSKAATFTQQGTLAYAKGYSDMIGGFISGAATLMDDAAKAAAGGAGGGGGAAAGGGGAAAGAGAG
jgi:hypothetical protein